MAGETAEITHLLPDLDDATVEVTSGVTGDSEVAGATAEVTNVAPDLAGTTVEVTLVST